MNKTTAAVIFGMAISVMPLTARTADLACSARGGSGQPVSVTILSKNQTPGWGELITPWVSSTLRLRYGNVLWLPTNDWPVVSVRVHYYNPSTGTYWYADDKATLQPFEWVINAHLENGDMKKEYPAVGVTINFLINTRVYSENYKLEWTRAGSSYDPNADPLDVTDTHSVTYSHVWTYEPVLDLGDHNLMGASVSHVFSQNPEPLASKLTLSFNMERGQSGSNTFRVNGQTGNAGTPLEVDGNTGPTLLEVQPSGAVGPFKGTVTATLKCL